MSERAIDETAAKSSPPPTKKGVARIIAATRYSMAGLRTAFRNEAAFRQEVIAFLILAPLGIWLGQSATDKVILVAVLVLVILVELLNTGIEAVVDRIGADYHELSRVAKDAGSAAVLISITLVVFTWGMLLLPPL